jgi:hypothetical protein
VTDDDEGRGSDGDAIDRWVSRQRRFAEVDQAARNTDVDVVPTTRLLAELLWELHDDGSLWKLLKKGQFDLEHVDDASRARALAAAEIDWEPFLIEVGYVPPPPMEKIADEFRIDFLRAIRNPGNSRVDDLKPRLARLARALDQALADDRPTGIRRLWALLRSYAPVAGRAAAVNGTAAAVTAGIGAVADPVVGAAAGGAARAGLDRALPKVALEEQVSTAEAHRFVRDQLRLEHYGRARADFDLLVGVVESSGGVGLLRAVDASGLEAVHAGLIEWVDEALAGVFLAWEKGAEFGGRELVMRLEFVTELLTRLRMALADLAPDHVGLRPCVEALAEAMQDLAVVVGHIDG